MQRMNWINAMALAVGLASVGPGGLGVAPASAETTVEQAAILPQVQDLVSAMRISELAQVLQSEGEAYGVQLKDEMFPDRGGSDWAAMVTRIYQADGLTEEFTRSLSSELAGKPEVATKAQAFFASPTGRKIIGLEIEARRAMLDDATEEAAKEAFGAMEAKGAPRVDALRRFVAANDLVEMNVMGALNANLAFYKGMSQGGAFTEDMTESDMLAEVWAQEDQVRQETEDWLWPYLALAYQPLSDEEMQAYQVFSEAPEGRALNAALFAAFDASFVRISGELGRAVALMVQGQDI
ncbi:MAG: hypothetical protein WAK98_11425 [Gemmobacter sp.]